MYVVSGATGQTGAAAMDALLAHGEAVRVVVRDEAKAAILRARGAEVVVASLDDEAAMTRALEGARGAFLLSPPMPASSDYLRDSRRLVEALAKAVRRSGVARIAFLSSIAAHRSQGCGPIGSLHVAEQLLSDTTASPVFVRAGYFLENWGAVLPAARADGALPSFLPVSLKLPQVSVLDVGRAAADALRSSGPPQIRELSGPVDVSAEDVAAALTRLFGKPVRAVPAPLSAVVPTFTSFGFSPHMAALYEELYRAAHAGELTWEGGAAQAVRGATGVDEAMSRLVAG